GGCPGTRVAARPRGRLPDTRARGRTALRDVGALARQRARDPHALTRGVRSARAGRFTPRTGRGPRFLLSHDDAAPIPARAGSAPPLPAREPAPRAAGRRTSTGPCMRTPDEKQIPRGKGPSPGVTGPPLSILECRTGPRILIVDDDPQMRGVLLRLLSRFSGSGVQAESAAEALRGVRGTPPALGLPDIG